ncbi:hypothetical protein T11_11469 [Trichinella zimbabwensis]|uniref:PiggyBac transposable element-derived protein domain-containing protein n=1 Tax=Trichinella zimbabwensis TaxID=268475 RepID=A0A0V1I2M1_9BILA|nr:hypothetical protein T11_11469 [Trichinella zimbabwensis]
MELHKIKLRMLGTDKTNKPELPKELAVCTGRANTMHPHSKASLMQDKKSDIIFATKARLDNVDKLLLTYTSKIKTGRFLVVTSANIINDRNLQMIDSEQSVQEAVVFKTFWNRVNQRSKLSKKENDAAV